MSTGLAPVRGALFALAVAHLGMGIGSTESHTSASDGAAFRLRWLSDLGAESLATDRAAAGPHQSFRIARVPGTIYLLSVDETGSPRREQRIEADFSMPYGLATTGESAVVAADDGSISLWDGLERGRLSLRWRRELGERAASVAWDGGDRVWVATRKDQLSALSAVDGATTWTVDIGGRAEAPVVRDGEALFVATKSRTLVRLDPASGKPKWKAELPGPANDPPVFAGENPRLVVCGTWNGHLVAVDAATGKEVWSSDLESRLAGPPVAGEDFAAAATENGAVRAFNLQGELLWKADDVVSGQSDILLDRAAAGDRLIVVSNKLKALDAGTGASVADYPADATQEIEKRFLGAMLEGKRPYSESEKATILARETFPVQGRLFGEALLQGEDLLFGTEEGWIYWFDRSSLRPICRYRAGQRASGEIVLTKSALVASGSEAVFALDPGSGRALWKRDLGAVRDIAAGESLAVVVEDRFDVLDPETGARQWSTRGEFESVAAVESSWIAFGRDGTIRMFDSAGNPQGAPIEAGGPIDAAVSLGERGWATSSKDGTVSAFERQDSLQPLWRTTIEGPIESLSYLDKTLVVGTRARLIGLGTADGSTLWEIPLAEGETFLSGRGGQQDEDLFVLGAGELRAYDPYTGVLRTRRAVDSGVIGATVRDEALVWLDVAGRAHRAPEASESGEQVMDLGVRLSRATGTASGFLVTTSAGEVGLVEIVETVGSAAGERY